MPIKGKKRVYIAGDGTEYPLEEAETALPIKVYKTDCKRSVVGDPTQCLIALGAKRDRSIEAAYIGSGKDAYVCFKARAGKPAHAKHYTITAKAGRIRDYFDAHKDATHDYITLSAPTAGRTLSHRSKLNKNRNARIKAGEHEPKRRNTPKQTRIMRLGLKHRPRARIKNGEVSIEARESAEG